MEYPPPLLLRTALYPQEVLSSLLARLAHLNLLTTSQGVENLIRDHLKQAGYPQDHLARPRQAATYDLLSHLTRIPVPDLYQATGHAFAAYLTPPGMAVPTGQIADQAGFPLLLKRNVLRDHLHSERHLPFCPHCLRERGYVPLNWMLQLVTVCTQHTCLLVARCDQCSMPARIDDLIRGVCPRCERRYRDIPTVSVRADGLGIRAQSWLETWVGLSTVTASDHPLPDQLPRAVYSLVSGLRRCLLLTAPLDVLPDTEEVCWVAEDEYKQPLSSSANHLLTTTALWALLDWPHHFHHLLDAYTQARGKTKVNGPNDRLGVLYSTYMETERYWRHPSCAFIQSAFNAYLTDHSQVMIRMQNSHRYREGEALRDQFTLVGMGEAGRILGVNAKKVRRLVREGHLSVVQTAGGSVMLARQEVFALREQWQKGYQGTEAVVRLLGVPPITVRRLRQQGVLPAAHVSGSSWLYDGDAVRALRAELMARTRPLRRLTGETLTFAVTCYLVGRIAGKGALGVLALIRQGRLTPYHKTPKTMRCDELRFQRHEVQTLFAQWQEETQLN